MPEGNHPEEETTDKIDRRQLIKSGAGGALALGMLGLAAGVGPLMAGVLHDLTGRYTEAFAVAIACCAISAIAIWLAAPGTVRAVAGRLPRARSEALR